MGILYGEDVSRAARCSIIVGILLYTRVVVCVILKTMRDSRCHSERSEESLGV